MSVDIKALEEVYDFIKAHQDRWNQGTWALKTGDNECGTAFCFAGWTCVLAGYDEFLWGRGSWGFVRETEAALVKAGDKVEVIPTLAAEILGISEMSRLFDGGNSLEQIRREISDIRAAELTRIEREQREQRARWLRGLRGRANA